LPNAYNKINSDVIAAGSNSKKLEATRIVARQHYFYLLGIFLCRFLIFISSYDLLVIKYFRHTEGKRIATTLLDAFTQRIGLIISLAVDTRFNLNF